MNIKNNFYIFINPLTDFTSVGMYNSKLDKVESHKILEGYVDLQNIKDAINDMVGSLNLSILDINTIILGAGPGSFTSIKMMLSFVKGICFVSKADIIYGTSLFAYIDIIEKNKEYNFLSNAKNNKAYISKILLNDKINYSFDTLKISDINIDELKNLIVSDIDMNDMGMSSSEYSEKAFCKNAISYGDKFSYSSGYSNMAPIYIKSFI